MVLIDHNSSGSPGSLSFRLVGFVGLHGSSGYLGSWFVGSAGSAAFPGSYGSYVSPSYRGSWFIGFAGSAWFLWFIRFWLYTNNAVSENQDIKCFFGIGLVRMVLLVLLGIQGSLFFGSADGF